MKQATESSARHLPLLDALERGRNVSQRALADKLGVSVSRVNRLLRDLAEEGRIEVVDETIRPFAYRLTDEGRAYHRDLRHQDEKATVRRFRKVEERIRRRLGDLREEGIRTVVFYGAGQILGVTLPLAKRMGIGVVGIVDDDPEKQGRRKDGFTVRPPEAIGELAPSAVVITTFRHAEEIREGLDEGAHGPLRVVEL